MFTSDKIENSYELAKQTLGDNFFSFWMMSHEPGSINSKQNKNGNFDLFYLMHKQKNQNKKQIQFDFRRGCVGVTFNAQKGNNNKKTPQKTTKKKTRHFINFYACMRVFKRLFHRY